MLGGVENGYGVANKSSPYFFFFGLEIIPRGVLEMLSNAGVSLKLGSFFSSDVFFE